MPEVSVIIPTYNRSCMLAQAMRSVLAQTHRDFELVIVDDGSTDNTRDVVEGFGDPRIRYIWQENQERSAARNRGVAEASCDLAAFLDSDDLWFPEKLEVQLPVFREGRDVGLVYSYCVRIDERGDFPYPQDFLRDDTGVAIQNMHSALLAGNAVLTPSVIVRKELFELAGGFDRSLSTSEDWDLWIRLSELCDFGFVPRPLAAFRVHPGNSVRDLDRLLKSDTEVLDKHFGPDTQDQRLRTEMRLYVRNGFTALRNGWPEAEYLLAQAQERASGSGSGEAVEKLLLTHAIGGAEYSSQGRLDAARTLSEAGRIVNALGGHVAVRRCLRDFWAYWAHATYSLQDHLGTLQCVSKLTGMLALPVLDRGIWAITAKSALRILSGRSSIRREFEIERELPRIVLPSSSG